MRIIGIALLVVVIAAVGWRYTTTQAPPPRGSGPAPVVLHTVAKQLVQQTLNALGTTQALQAVALSSTITERVVALPLQEGKRVKQGTVLAVLENNEELAQQKIAEVELAEHRREYRRIADLVKARTIPSSELDRLQSLIDAAIARLSEVNAQLAERTITAPFDGVVGLRQMSTGALARPGDIITTLDSIDELLVDFNIAERHLAALTPGRKITARNVAFPEQGFIGSIETVSPRVDEMTRSVTVRAIIDNQDGKLRPGMLLDIAILKTERQAIVIPEEAVFMRGESHLVYWIDGENKAQERKVNIGTREKGQVEITQGLAEGDAIVAKGLLKVKPGQAVKPQVEEWRNEERQNKAQALKSASNELNTRS